MKNEIAENLLELLDGPRIFTQSSAIRAIKSALDEYGKSLGPKRVPGLFHPGDYIKEEMKARGWDFADLCIGMYKQPATVQQIFDIQAILDEKFTIGTHEAEALEKAFGSSANEWLILQATYNAGIAIKKMKAAEELAELVEDEFGAEMDRRLTNLSKSIRYAEYSKWVALARKITPEVKDV